ncbi:MAG: hypothetical protein WAN50_01085 [Minisyncoccia bacterium]
MRKLSKRIWALDPRAVEEARKLYEADPEGQLVAWMSVLYSFRHIPSCELELDNLVYDGFNRAWSPDRLMNNYHVYDNADQLDVLSTIFVWFVKRHKFAGTILEWCNLIAWQLGKDPGSYQGTFAKFTGQILQIQQSGNDGIIRLSVTDEGYGIWSPNDVVYVEYHQATTAVNGDIVTIYGMLNGSTTYTSQANYQITLPDMVACAVGAIPAATTSSASNSPTNTKMTPTPVSNTNATANTVASTPPTPSAPASPTCTLSLSPTSIVGGNSATLSWTTTNTTSLSLDHGINFVSPISSGSTSVSPPAGTTYTGTATGPGGSVICTGSIAVTAPATWHTTVTYNGGTDTKTSPFTMNGTEWRITYSCSPTDTSDSTSDLFGSIESTNGELSGFDNFANDAQCPVSNSVSYVYAQTPGQYYLDIGPINSSYTVTVEDLY